MKRIVVMLAAAASLFISQRSNANEVWKQLGQGEYPSERQMLHPDSYKIFSLDESTLRLQFATVGTTPETAEIIAVPMADGTMREFRIWETPMMPSALAAQFPDIKTYTGTAVDNPVVGIKVDFTLYGFHAMVYDGENTCFVDPIDNYHDGYYLLYYKRDLTRSVDKRMACDIHGDELTPNGESALPIGGLPPLGQKTISGYNKRTYRLALACSSQYATTVTGVPTPTVAQVLSKMTTTMNRVNGVYEREFALTMTFVTNETSLIFTTVAGDPYYTINSNGNSCLTANRTQCNTIIGSTNYDIGHVFTTGSGGIASLGCVCTSLKAEGTTGSPSPSGDAFDIDYVAHEMGHQYGSDHTFNDNANGSCGGNAASSLSYEPGSGSTIMAYAGICTGDDVQAHSDAYFHAASLDKIITFINGTGNCATLTATNNKSVKYTPLTTTSYSIPYLTPFELYAPTATDSLTDSALVYCWEEYDLGGADFGNTWATTTVGPIFRSISPTTSTKRIFPKSTTVLAGLTTGSFEKCATVARTMKFKLTLRNVRNNLGVITFPDEMITLSAVTTGTGTGFTVSSQSTTGIVYTGGSTQTITWNQANTQNAPVSASQVDIYMSLDGGNTWNYSLGTYSNTGTATVTVPNPAASTTLARFKVKGHGNVFFNVNTKNFTVNKNPSISTTPPNGVSTTVATKDVSIYPVPATANLHIDGTAGMDVMIYNMVGPQVWQGTLSGNDNIDVASWARGVYVVRVLDKTNGTTIAKQVSLQ